VLAILIPLLTLAAAQDATPKPVSIPTSVQSWTDMTDAQRSRYARITVEALKRNPMFARCDALDADVLEIRVSEMAEPGSPLIMAVAGAAYAICSEVPKG